MMNIFKKIKSELKLSDVLDKIIKEKPKSFDMDKLKDDMVVEVNDKVYREQTSLPKKFAWDVFLSVVFGFSIFMYGVFLNTDNFIVRIISIIICLILSILWGAYDIFASYKELILNREEGTITFYKQRGKKRIVIPFEEGDGFLRFIAGGGVTFDFILMFLPKSRKGPCGILALVDIYAFWDFVVWYMDKNRPLPPGTAFDPYREADFQRRKAEGFPKPLYKSYIPTPEATRHQQLERERIGKW